MTDVVNPIGSIKINVYSGLKAQASYLRRYASKIHAIAKGIHCASISI